MNVVAITRIILIDKEINIIAGVRDLTNNNKIDKNNKIKNW